jgi:hypothetical protein
MKGPMLTSRTALIVFFCAGLLAAAEKLPQPSTVCEIVKETGDGKVVLAVGRFSFRKEGSFLSQESCSGKPAVLWLADDSKSAPRVPPVLELDGKAVDEKLGLIKQTTTLRRFRFGSPDYDQWAVVYGAVKKDEKQTPPLRLLIRGDGAIVFLTPEER